MKSLHWFMLVVITIAVSYTGAAADEWQPANDQADANIANYQRARRSGDPTAIREATLQLQADPLAIRKVNRTSTDAFKTQLNQDIGAVQERTRGLIKQRLAEIGVKPKRVGTFEATNPPKPGDPVKVGQDWDLTVRVDGRDLPTKVSQRIVHDAYYEASTGNKPPPATDAAARSEYTRAADHHAQRQSLANTDYQFKEAYGGAPTEGGQILFGAKDPRLRDSVQLTQVIDYKSNEARILAAELRAEGKLGAAVGHDIEEMRQSTKQFDRQVRPRVEAALGDKVPEGIKHITEGQDIMKQVDAGEITPAEARSRLSEMGETRESIIRKTSELVEAVHVLKPPGQRGEPAPDVFVENVKNRLQSRRLVKVLERVESGELTTSQAREQISQIEEINLDAIRKPEGNPTGKKPLTEGKSSVAPGPLSIARQRGLQALGALWITSTAAEAAAHEERRALEAGEEPDWRRSGGNAMAEATLIPNIFRAGERGQQYGQEELLAAAREGRGKASALLRGWGRVVGDVTAWSLGSGIAQEEIEAEERRAAQEGREPSYSRSALNGAVRGLGEVLMINSIARAANSVTEEEVVLAGQQQVVRAWAQGKLNESQKELSGIQLDLQEAMAERGTNDATFDPQYEALRDRYDKARRTMTRLADTMRRQLGEDDPLVKSIKERIGRLPDPPDAQLPPGGAELAGNQPDAELPPADDEVGPDELYQDPPGTRPGDQPDAELPPAEGEVGSNELYEDPPGTRPAGRPSTGDEKGPTTEDLNGTYAIYVSAAGAGRTTRADPFEAMVWKATDETSADVTLFITRTLPDAALAVAKVRRTVHVSATRRVDRSGNVYYVASGADLTQAFKNVGRVVGLQILAMGAGAAGTDAGGQVGVSVRTASITIVPTPGSQDLNVTVKQDMTLQIGNIVAQRINRSPTGFAKRLD